MIALHGFVALLSLLAVRLSLVKAEKNKINHKYNEICSGMYSKEDWGGKVNPFISFNLKKFTNDLDDDSGVVVAIYEYKDRVHLGATTGENSIYYICDDFAIDSNLCDESQKDKFIIEDEVYDPHTKTNKTLTNPILTFSQKQLGLHDKKFSVTSTGFYCVTAFGGNPDIKFEGLVNFRNAYGQLSGSEVNKLPLYGLLAVGYVVAMALYSFAVWKHKHELLPLHKYVLAFFVFLTAETIFVWAYYDIMNEKGINAGVKVYSVFLSILTAGKITFSFFMLLIVALGYGIVYPKLNRNLMRRCQIFAIFAFLVNIGFLLESYLIDLENGSMLILITLIPMVITMTFFYFLVLRSMTKTVTYLKDQRQVVKLMMYKKLLVIIYASFLVMVAGIVIASFFYAGMSDIDIIEKNWRSSFFITDFWPTLVYFIVFVVIAFVWRPTDTSYMLAASQQLPADSENIADFDLGDLQSLDEPDDLSIITDDDRVPSPDGPVDPNKNKDTGSA